MLDNLADYHIFLASKSPRRRELLKMLRVKFNTVTIGIKEEYPSTLPPEEVPEYLSRVKADAYRSRLLPGQLVITADTVVISDGEVMGKPSDRKEAMEMLRKLSGKTHKVVTGVSIVTGEKTRTFRAETLVTFDTISPDDIEYYVEMYSPLDKAGAYGIQEWIGAVGISEIRGSFYNVMGLPLHKLYKELKNF